MRLEVGRRSACAARKALSGRAAANGLAWTQGRLVDASRAPGHTARGMRHEQGRVEMAKQRILGNRDGRALQAVLEEYRVDTQELKVAVGHSHVGGLVEDHLMSMPKISLITGTGTDVPAVKEINLGHTEKEIQDDVGATTYPEKTAALADSLFCWYHIKASDRCRLKSYDPRGRRRDRRCRRASDRCRLTPYDAGPFLFNTGDLSRANIAKPNGINKGHTDNCQKNSHVGNMYMKDGNRAYQEFEPDLCKRGTGSIDKPLAPSCGFIHHGSKHVLVLCYRIGGRP